VVGAGRKTLGKNTKKDQALSRATPILSTGGISKRSFGRVGRGREMTEEEKLEGWGVLDRGTRGNFYK